jgi:hypothetical protein
MSKINLVDSLFDVNHSFEAAVLCTYGIDLNFFENYLLLLRGLYQCETISLFVDATTYDNFINASYIPRKLNQRYLITRVKTAGVFHTKLYLLASSRKALIGIGSPNLTRDGITSNLELLSVFEVSERKPEFALLLRDCLSYVQRVAQLSGSEQAMRQVDVLNHLCAPLMTVKNQQNIVRLLHNLDRPLLDLIVEEIGNQRVIKAHIISPFFDTGLAPLHVLRQRLADCQIEFYLQQKKSNFPLDHFRTLGSSASIMLYNDLERYLHGKAIVLEGKETSIVYMGSANFTRPALMTKAVAGNFEIGIVGRIDRGTTAELLQPADRVASKVHSAAEVEVDVRQEFELANRGYIDYLLEAVLEIDHIRIQVNPEIGRDVFQPYRYRLIDFADNRFEDSYTSNPTIFLSPRIRKLFPSSFAVQLIGADGQGKQVESNLVWAIALEQRSASSGRSLLRRVYNDPSQLFTVLEEIAAKGNERDLMLFLQQFDIPLDLILPPRKHGGFRNVKSKGNLIASLPFHQSAIFSSNMLLAYEVCLQRLLGKLQKHRLQLQPDKLDNFLLIYSTLLVLLDFINAWAYEKYQMQKHISADDWGTIRNIYNMLMEYTTKAWDLVWSKDGYRNAINTKLAGRHIEEDEESERFEQHLIAEYSNSPEELSEFLMRPLRSVSVQIGN